MLGSRPSFPSDIGSGNCNDGMCDPNHKIPPVIRVPMLTPPQLADKFRNEKLREDAVYEFYLPIPEANYRATVHWMRTSYQHSVFTLNLLGRGFSDRTVCKAPRFLS